MKHIGILLFIFLITCMNIYSQTNWFAEGAKWTYMVDPGFSSNFGRSDAQIKIKTDTIINNRTYNVMSQIELKPNLILNRIDTNVYSDIIVRQEGNTIYHLSENGNEFPIYEFDAEIGDTLAINGIVTNIDSVEYNGLSLRVQYIRMLCIEYSTGNIVNSNVNVAFIEKFGHENSRFLPYQLTYGGCLSTPVDIGGQNLKCFSDVEIGGVLFFGQDCSIVGNVSSIQNKNENTEFKIQINNNTLEIVGDINIRKTQILDLQGSIICRNNSLKYIDLGDIPLGIYIIRIQTKEGEVISRKFFYSR